MSTGLKTAEKKKELTIFDTIGSEAMKKQFAAALPKHMTPDRFARIALTAMRRTPKLSKCTPDSVLGCLMSLSQYGLEPDGRRAHLIPFDKKDKQGNVLYTECTLILDYKGLVELVMRSGLVSFLHADQVCEGDVFEYNMGEIVKHVPWFLRRDKEKPADEGEVYAVYATCVNKDGTRKSEVMSVGEIDKIRGRSKSKDDGPWVTDTGEMRKKTVFKRLSKWLVLSPEFRDAAADDDDNEFVIDTTATSMTERLESKSAVGKLLENGSLEGKKEDTEEQKQERVSQFDKCRQWLEIQPLVSVKVSDPEKGSITFVMPDKSLCEIGDGVNTNGGVDTMDDDSYEQIKNIYEKASK